MNLSFWDIETWEKPVDVIVAGAGIVGLSAAVELKKQAPRLSVLVLDRGLFPSGGSTKNAGFACFGSLSELAADFNECSDDEVFALVKKRYDGLVNLRNLIGDKNMDYSPCGGFEVFKPEQEQTLDSALAVMQKMNSFLEEMTSEKEVYQNASKRLTQFGFQGIHYMIENRLEGQINTGKMMNSLRRIALELGVDILMGTGIQEIERSHPLKTVHTNNGLKLKCKNAIIATNAFASQLLPELEVKPGRAQVLITSEIPDLNWEGTFHMDQGYFYFRNVGKRILFGGGRHLFREAETTFDQTITEEVQAKLDQILREVILPKQDYQIEHRWAGTLGLGGNRMPIVEKIEPGLFAGVKMGGMGVAIGSLIGKELAELVLNN